MSKKINVNPSNSKIVEGKLFISEMKANSIFNTALGKLIEYDSYIIYPGMGKLVQYSGPYSRNNS